MLDGKGAGMEASYFQLLINAEVPFSRALGKDCWSGSMWRMISTHERYVTDASGARVEVIVPLDEWNRLCAAVTLSEEDVVARWVAGELATGNAARLLGLTYAAFLRLVSGRGLSAISMTTTELDADLAQL